MSKISRGPWTLEQNKFELYVQGPNFPIVTASRFAYSSNARTVDDVMNGVGFEGAARDDAIERNAEQLATLTAIAALPDLISELKNIIAECDAAIAYETNSNPNAKDLPNGLRSAVHIKLSMIQDYARAALRKAGVS